MVLFIFQNDLVKCFFFFFFNPPNSSMWLGKYYYSYFIGEETEAQRTKVT